MIQVVIAPYTSQTSVLINLIYLITHVIEIAAGTDASNASDIEHDPYKNTKWNTATSHNKNMFGSYWNTNVTRTLSPYETNNLLYRDLLTGYNTQIRPLRNQKQSITVELNLQILQLLAIDGVSESVVIDCYVFARWVDQLLTWSFPETHVFLLMPSKAEIWTPDLFVTNAQATNELLGTASDVPLTVIFNGKTFWGFDERLKTSCRLEMDKYPFDVQTCHVEVSPALSSTHNGGISLKEEGVECFAKSNDWDILETTAQAGNRSWNGNEITTVKFTLTMKRKPMSFLVNNLLPTIILSLLNSFVFLVPIESGEKISFGISVLLALAVFISNTRDKLPTASDGYPAVTKYLGNLLVVSMLAVVLTVTNARLHRYFAQHQRQSRTPLTDSAQPTPAVSPASDDNENNNDNENNDNENNENLEPAERNQCGARRKLTATHRHPFVSILDIYLRHSDILGFFILAGTWACQTAMYFKHVLR